MKALLWKHVEPGWFALGKRTESRGVVKLADLFSDAVINLFGDDALKKAAALPPGWCFDVELACTLVGDSHFIRELKP